MCCKFFTIFFYKGAFFLLFPFFFFFFFGLFRAAPVAYASSQARSQIGAGAAGLCHSHTRSLTHWVRPGIKPTSLWILVRFITTEPPWELQGHTYLNTKAIVFFLLLLWLFLLPPLTGFHGYLLCYEFSINSRSSSVCHPRPYSSLVTDKDKFV